MERKDTGNPELGYFQAAEILKEVFVVRDDTFAVQTATGSYYRVEEPLRWRHLVNHLQGKITLATYILDKKGMAKYCVLDADDNNDMSWLLEFSGTLYTEGVTPWPELSRRGGHMWFFFTRPMSGRAARRFGESIIQRFDLPNVEVYPKTTDVTEGPGNCIRLPFGTHQKSGKRYPFIYPNGDWIGKGVREQLAKLYIGDRVPMSAARMMVAEHTPAKIKKKRAGYFTPEQIDDLEKYLSGLESKNQ